jgi:uncharacterized membrane protein (GlpM family)
MKQRSEPPRRRMELKLLPLYFVIGGLTVAITVYFGSQGKGMLAAFAGLFPGITIITFCALYFQGGATSVTSYARGMLILLPAWILYVLGVYFLIPRLGLAPTLLLSVGFYLVSAYVILRFTHF